MNREEAIYFANCLKNNYTVDLNDMEAFCDMAIKALAQEPTTKNDLGVEEVTALAEWTTKLTKASEDAYNKGFADGANEVLDKIRAEIKQLPDMDEAGVFSSVRMKSMVLDILDKYKAESEKA